MRALCEGCGKPQPPDWSPGEQCVHCGRAVRRDVRCFWCAKWTPAAKFCRSCGAETVDPRLYGAARMLKDAGTDRFTVPKQLREFDPDQIENFSRIYQRHAIAVARHVDELRFLERFLHHKTWSAALEEQLVPQLPWPDETLERLSATPLPPGNDLSVAKAVGQTSPFGTTRALAVLARLRLDDWTAYQDALGLLRDPALRPEAALVLTGWRVLSTFGAPRGDRALVEELRKSPFKLPAAVRLGLLGVEEPDLLKDARASADPETSFAAALALGDVDRLRAALQEGELEKVAAGRRLVELGVLKPVVETVEKSPLEVQHELVESLLRRKEPAPEAADTLLRIVEGSEDRRLRERAARILCRQLDPAWVRRIAEACKGDTAVYQSLLQAEGLTPEAARELGDLLIAHGRFRMSQYGLSAAAEKGRMPLDFVPARFAGADEETRKELLRFAEAQLGQAGDEGLHRFLLNVVFGPPPAKIRAAAWWALRRTYRGQGDHRGEGPFALRTELVARFFGAWGDFLPRLAAVLRNPDTLKEVGYYEMLAHVLDSADEEAVAAIQADPAADALLDALLEALRGEVWPGCAQAMITLASRVGSDAPRRARTLDALRALGKKGNYYWDKAVRRLELALYDLPEESAWTGLPADFVPSRFPAASAEGRRELLKIADQQLIHRKEEVSPVLMPFLLETALRPGGPRDEAMAIYEDRARSPYGDFPLQRDAVEQSFGSYEAFLALLPAALRDPGPAARFLRELFTRPGRAVGGELARAGGAGRAVIQAMLEAGSGPEDADTSNFRRSLLRYLEHAGAHPDFRMEVHDAFARVAPDLAPEAARIRKVLLPPSPRDKVAPEEDPGAGWAEKQAVVDRLAAELRETLMRLMAGPASPEEKMREATRLNQEFQARIKELYS